MIRGINKRVIEINETGNPYFERAVLYMNENSSNNKQNFDDKNMEEEAKRYLSTIKKVRWSGKISWKESFNWKFLLSALSGGAISYILFALM